MRNNNVFITRIKSILVFFILIIVLFSAVYFCFFRKVSNPSVVGTWENSMSTVDFYKDGTFKNISYQGTDADIVIEGTYELDNTKLYLTYLYPIKNREDRYLDFTYLYEIDKNTLKLRDIQSQGSLIEYTRQK